MHKITEITIHVSEEMISYTSQRDGEDPKPVVLCDEKYRSIMALVTYRMRNCEVVGYSVVGQLDAAILYVLQQYENQPLTQDRREKNMAKCINA